MVTWAEFEAAAPGVATAGRRLLYRDGRGAAMLATVRGTEEPPRMNPITLAIVDGRVFAFILQSRKLVDLERANAEFPPFPKYTIPTGPVHTAFFFTAPGSVYWATKSGTWGDARKSSAEAGERYLEAGVRSTLAILENIEATFKAMPPR